LITSVLAK
jgi:hypothetical protein